MTNGSSAEPSDQITRKQKALFEKMLGKRDTKIMHEQQQQTADSIVRSWPYEAEQGDGIHEFFDFVKSNYGSEVFENRTIMNDAIARLGFTQQNARS